MRSFLSVTFLLCSVILSSQSITVDFLNRKQQINMMGGDMERSQRFLQKASNPQEIADWLYKDIAFMTCRVSYDKQQELVEGAKNFAFYDDAIASMKMVQHANPNIKFYATMKSDYNGYANESNLPDWICDDRPNTWFDSDKYAGFLADYLELMHQNNVGISYIAVAKEWTQVINIARTIQIINKLKPILIQRNVPVPLFTDPGSWSVNQGVSFVNDVIAAQATHLFYAFSTHDYNNSEGKYPEFVQACKRAGKYAWNDETPVGHSGENGVEPPSMERLLWAYSKRADMYAAGIDGEICFENFSRGINKETRSIYFTNGKAGIRLRSYYIFKEFANHVYEHYYVPVNTAIFPGVKTMTFVNDGQIALWVMNNSENDYQNFNINISNTSIEGLVTHHSFDSLTNKQGEKRILKSNTDLSYSAHVKPLSVNFFHFKLQPETSAEPYSLPFQEMYNGLVSDVEHTSDFLNATLPTRGWEIAGSIATPNPQPSPNPFGWKKPGDNNPCVKTIGEGGYLLTPAIDIPSGTPIEFSFMARMLVNDKGADNSAKIVNNLERNFYVTIGNDTVYDHHKMCYDIAKPLFQNPNRWMGTFIYEGDGPARLKFFASNTFKGIWDGNPDGLAILSNGGEPTVDNTGTLVRETNNYPALNIGFGHNIDLGTIALSEFPSGSTVHRSFSLKGINLSNKVTMSDESSVSVKLPVKTYYPVSGVVNEEVPIQITVPESTGTYIEKISLTADAVRVNNATETPNSPTRAIWFKFKVEETLGVGEEVYTSLEILAKEGAVHINSPEETTAVNVYSLSGILIKSLKNVQSAIIPLPKGVYLVQTDFQVKKVIL